MNGDTIEHLVRFMERTDDRLPSRVSNGMILLAIREERDARKRENQEVLKRVEALAQVLEGKEADGSDGLIQQIGQLRVFKNALVWVFSAVALAFLGGLGMYLFRLAFG